MPIKKKIIKKDKDGNDKTTKIPYKTRFIDTFRFMSSSLSNLVDNLSEGTHSDKCIDCKSYLGKHEQLILRCFEPKKNYEKDFNKELIKRFTNIYKFCNGDINKLILLLRKGVYPYEYMDSWERFNETSLPDKEAFYNSLNMEDITYADHRHAKKVFKNLGHKNLGDYHYSLQMYLKISETCVLKYMS